MIQATEASLLIMHQVRAFGSAIAEWSEAALVAFPPDACRRSALKRA